MLTMINRLSNHRAHDYAHAFTIMTVVHRTIPTTVDKRHKRRYNTNTSNTASKEKQMNYETTIRNLLNKKARQEAALNETTAHIQAIEKLQNMEKAAEDQMKLQLEKDKTKK